MIRHFEGLNYTPAVELGYRANLELMQLGLGEAVQTLSWDHNAIVAYEADTPIGVIVWSEEKYNKHIWVTLSYVLPQHRRKGVFAEMWKALIEKAIVLKVMHIRSMTHARNHRMRDVAKKLGRVEDAVRLTFTVPGVTDGTNA